MRKLVPFAIISPMENKVLILEDFLDLSSILPKLNTAGESFRIDPSSSIDEAVELAKKNIYQIVYIGLGFFNADIITLLEVLHTKQFSGRFVLAGDYKKKAVQSRMGIYKSMDMIIKPFDSKWFEKSITEHFTIGSQFGNDYKKLLNPSFWFKILCIEKGTLALKLVINGNKGLVIFESGVIVYAKFENYEGEKAVREIIHANYFKGKNEMKITTPGLFKKKVDSIDFIQLLESANVVNNNVPDEPVIQKKELEYAPLIKFIVENIGNYYQGDGVALITETVQRMGHQMSDFPQAYEIDLIEEISVKFENSADATNFRKFVIGYMMNRN